jgi:predicted NACHT family NTPase
MDQKEKTYHRTLAEYFLAQPLFFDEKREKPNRRKCIEQPFQQTKGELWNEVTETLCEIFFVEAKVKAGLIDGLQGDYKEALKGMAEGEEKKCMDEFYYLFMRQKHILAGYPGLTFQQMYNELQWKEGRIKQRVEKAREGFLGAGGRFLRQYREPKIEKSNLIMTLNGHNDFVTTCAFSPDGKWIVSGSDDSSFKLWDIDKGNEITTLKGHSKAAYKLSPKGDRINSGSIITSCAFSPNGKWIVSGDNTNTCTIWDVTARKEKFTFFGGG